MHHLTQRFFFEAAHTLHRNVEGEEKKGSQRIHGHTYKAAVTVRGYPHVDTGMLVDLAHLRASLDAVKACLDHQFLDEVEEVAAIGPATLEILCIFIAKKLKNLDITAYKVEIERGASGDSCAYYPEEGQ